MSKEMLVLFCITLLTLSIFFMVLKIMLKTLSKPKTSQSQNEHENQQNISP